MVNIRVNLPQNAYQVAIAPNILTKIGEHLKELNIGKKVLIISNPEIWSHYGQFLSESINHAGYHVYHHLIPAGETHKNLASIQQVYDTAYQYKLERSSTILALGGGVIGDMAGFAAATWLRGINFIQVPTSLLAMVDASIGGKTGVNHPQGKNLIGAFYQPKAVFIDPDVLQTLPPREFRAGMAEVIKYGIIWDEDLFTKLETAPQLNSLDRIEPELLHNLIVRSVQAKADVVSQDEREAGLRAILNYGHTIGHAVESLTSYSQFVHGEAVAIGMVAAGKIAQQLNMWTKDEALRQQQLIIKTGLPIDVPSQVDPHKIIESLQGDKKVKDGRVRFILPTKIGKVIITDQVPSTAIISAVS
jgi:3-dehydroquinate synthase